MVVKSVKVLNKEFKTVRRNHHHRFINCGTCLLIVSAVAFAIEFLAIGGITGVLGALLAGLADTE